MIDGGSMCILKKKEGKVAKIIGAKSGADKGDVKNILYNGKYYFVYTDQFKGPPLKSKLTKADINRYTTENGIKLKTILREIGFVKKLQKTKFVPKIFISDLFERQKHLRVMFATEDLSRKGFKNVGWHVDAKKVSLSFLDVKVTNGVHYPLHRFLKYQDSGYSRFMHPKYINANLEKWYIKNEKFLNALFDGLTSIHKMDIYHHDLHAGNVWYNGRKVMFIDFGRASTMKESFEIRSSDKPEIIREKRSFSRVKNIHERRMLAELSKNKANPTGRHEFFRHDVDNKIMVDQLYGTSHYLIVNKFKRFLAVKYKNRALKKKQ
jgi:serine/threonine protein kinase